MRNEHFCSFETDFPQDLEFDEALQRIKVNFKKYMDENVLNGVKKLNLKIYYTGIPAKKFDDYTILMDDLFSGELLEILSKNVADESVINDM